MNSHWNLAIANSAWHCSYDRLKVRYQHYNETLDYIQHQEGQGNAFVMRPSIATPVGRVERNKERLESLYELGWNDAKEQFDELKRFLGKNG